MEHVFWTARSEIGRRMHIQIGLENVISTRDHKHVRVSP